jgi:predicted Rossmann fold nucleotide-binding protein DprA/Smf involved in DNA uptake
MKIGIVGSRRRATLKDRQIVTDIIYKAVFKFGKDEIEIVSGGCRSGADSFAKETATIYKLKYKEFPIQEDPPPKHKGEFTERAYARNRQIAEYSDVVFALIHDDRTGGTENTIKHCQELGTKIFLVDLEGKTYLLQDGTEADKA